MKKNWDYYLLTAICIVCVVLLSCGSVLDRLTPSDIPDQSITYSEVDPNEIGQIMFYNLHEAKQVMRKIVTVRRDRLIDWEYALKKDDALYQDAKGYLEPAIAHATEVQEILVGSEEQPFSIIGLLALGCFGGLGTLLGKNMLKRKHDYTTKEYENAMEVAYKEGIKDGKGD